MGRTSVIREHADKILADGLWHDMEDVLYKVMHGVPPNLAVREAERVRAKRWLADNPGKTKADVPPRKRNTNLEQQVRIGARLLAKSVLYTESFEHAMHPGMKRKIVRKFDPLNQTPLPAGYVSIYHGRKSSWAGMTPEQIREKRSERTRKATATRLRRQGHDPATYKTLAQRIEEERLRRAQMTPDELKEMRSANSRKGWETRKNR